MRPVRIAIWVFVGFVAGSLLTGGLEGTAFKTNLIFGAKWGAPAALIAGGLVWAYEYWKSRQAPS